MQFIDRFLQGWRCRKAAAWVPAGARVLDIGCHHGEFFEMLGDRIGPSVGLDPNAPERATSRYELRRLAFRDKLPFPDASFDVVSMLALIEHVPNRPELIRECRRVVADGGRVIVTVPRPAVDGIVLALVRLRLAHGMSIEEHTGFDPEQLPVEFEEAGFRLVCRRRFQLGLNNVMVFAPAAEETGE